MNFLVTGTGRSGTKFVSQALQEMGIKCGHESVYTPRVARGGKSWDGDSSWFGVPHIVMGSPRPEHVVHVARDPRRVLASRFSMGFGKYDRPALMAWRPDLFPAPEETALRRAWVCALYCALIDGAEGISDATFRIEDIVGAEAESFCAALGYPDIDVRPLRELPRDIHARRPSEWEDSFEWDSLPEEVLERAGRLGYEVG